MARTRAEGFGPEVIRRALLGTYSLSAGVLRRLLRPGTEGPGRHPGELRQGLRAGRRAGLADEPDRCVRRRCPDLGSARHVPVGHLQHPPNMAGHPAISVPVGLDEAGLPIGFQVMAPALGEETMYQVACRGGASRRLRSRRGPWKGGVSWEPVIGIEVHVELMTASKMFCGCAVAFGGEPNTRVCPTCLGLPGALPVTNRVAIESIMAIGLALDCQVSERSVFHRKNYFYADLPKNYQISQFDVPVCHDGHLDIEVDGQTRRIGIERPTWKRTPEKTISEPGAESTPQRALFSISTGRACRWSRSCPDRLRSAFESRVYAQELRSIVAELGVSDARLEEGSIRFDANVSIRAQGEEEFGTKVEIKNMNSFPLAGEGDRIRDRAADRVVESGGEVIQERVNWMRSPASPIRCGSRRARRTIAISPSPTSFLW